MTRREGVDDETWTDLELDPIFTAVDSTLTRVGSQVLYRRFRTFDADAEYSAYSAPREDAALRERIQLALLGLQADSDALICDRLFGKPPEKPRFITRMTLTSQLKELTEDPDLAEVFDYRLRPGASHSRNAIRLLEKIGFPSAVVEEARRIAAAKGD